MALLKENKQLKSMLLLHLNVIQEQSDMLVAKDKQIAALQGKLDRLERKFAAGLIKPATPPPPDENTPNGNNATVSLAGVVPTGIVGNIATGAVRPVAQQLSRGTIMKMAALNQASAKGQLRIRPLMISLKKVMPAVVDQQQQQQQQVPQSQSQESTQTWNQFLSSHKIVTKSEDNSIQPQVKNEIGRPANPSATQPVVKETPAVPPHTPQNHLSRTNGNTVGVVADDSEDTETGGSDVLAMDTLADSPEIVVSDGSPIDLPMELKIEEDDDALSPVKSQEHRPQQQQQQSSSPNSVKLEPSTKVLLHPLTRESLTNAMRFDVSAAKPKRSPSECSNRAPRKYSRVMSTRKLYVTRHWEEEDAEEPNSLVVAELKEGESNLEVPNWKEIDAQGLDDEIQGEDAPKIVVATEDLSPAAFLKRHAKHEADERRRKKWDIQRFREQRTIEKLKKRQCKADIYLPSVGAAGQQQSQCSASIDALGENVPTSLYPNLSSIRHVETTEYLPVQAFGEPIPTLHSQEFALPWQGGMGDAEGSVEMIMTVVTQDGNGFAQSSQSSNMVGGNSSFGPMSLAGGGGGGGGGDLNNGLNSGNIASKYSSFYVKQNSNLMPMRLSSSNNNAKYRFKRVKSQGSSSGRR